MSKNKLYLYKAFFCFFVILLPFSLCAQTNITVNYTDATEKTFTVTENGKIYFSEDNLVLEEDFNSSVTIAFSSIRKLMFETQPTSSNTEQSQWKENQIFIYPNPAQDYLHIVNLETDNVTAKIFSISGNLMWQGVIIRGEYIDVNYLPTGFYLIQLNETVLKFTKR